MYHRWPGRFTLGPASYFRGVPWQALTQISNRAMH